MRSIATDPAALVMLVLAPSMASAQLTFTPHTIATELGGGYQVVAADLNADGRPDLIALASRLTELLWFENPTWERHVIVGARAGMINLAARDLDGDGIPEIALAEGFSTRPERSEGIVSLLTHQGDPTALWSIREIDRVPTAHRLRWIDFDGDVRLVNAPLAGATSEPPDYRGETPLYVYEPGAWIRTLIANDGGVVHGIQPVAWNGDSSVQALLSASFLGVHLHQYAGSDWTRTRIHPGDPSDWPASGSSEVGLGHVGGQDFIATIDPWHGHQVAIYTRDGDAWARHVIDDTLEDGHTLVVGDLDGDGSDEIVAGARRGAQVAIYRASGGEWTKQVIDDGGMAAAGCAITDLNDDGRLDIACIGSGTANLKWYENQSVDSR
jgi:hypothetical protein